MAFPIVNFSLFRLLAPEFSSISNSDIQLIGDAVSEFFNEQVWGSKIELGFIYLIAHTLKMSQRSGNAGRITSSKVGDLSRNYASPKDDNEYSQTSYGVKYLSLVNGLASRPYLVT